MKRKTENVLLELGITPNLKGFEYICRGVEILQEKEGRIKVVDGLYVQIAEEYNTKKQRVERAIRHAISKVEKDGDPWRKYIGIHHATNSSFLFILATRLRED